MGLFDRLEGIIIDKAARVVLLMLKEHPGQANQLAQELHRTGLGHLVQSWAGPGANLKITPAQVENVLAEEHIAKVAKGLGISQGEAAIQIADLLPVVMSGSHKGERGFVVE